MALAVVAVVSEQETACRTCWVDASAPHLPALRDLPIRPSRPKRCAAVMKVYAQSSTGCLGASKKKGKPERNST